MMSGWKRPVGRFCSSASDNCVFEAELLMSITGVSAVTWTVSLTEATARATSIVVVVPSGRMMSARRGSVVVLWTALSCAACMRAGTRPIPPHDLIVITIDTLRADRVAGGAAGSAPALEALGREGAVFLDASAHIPLTLPSHASI